jgi:hypothetical protein
MGKGPSYSNREWDKYGKSRGSQQQNEFGEFDFSEQLKNRSGHNNHVGSDRVVGRRPQDGNYDHRYRNGYPAIREDEGYPEERSDQEDSDYHISFNKPQNPSKSNHNHYTQPPEDRRKSTPYKIPSLTQNLDSKPQNHQYRDPREHPNYRPDPNPYPTPHHKTSTSPHCQKYRPAQPPTKPNPKKKRIININDSLAKQWMYSHKLESE